VEEVALASEVVAGAVLDDAAVVDDQDAVEGREGGEAVCDRHHGAVAHEADEGALDLHFGFGVERRCGLVQDDDGALSTAQMKTRGFLVMGPGQAWPPECGEARRGSGREHNRGSRDFRDTSPTRAILTGPSAVGHHQGVARSSERGAIR